MTRTLAAVYDGEVLRPEAPLDLLPNTRCRITLEVDGIGSTSSNGADAWALLAQLAGSVAAPADWSEQHDHYLYGTPKRNSDCHE